MTNLIKTLFLRELTVSGHTLEDIFSPKGPTGNKTLWQMIKDPNQKLNILNLNESKEASTSAIVTMEIR